MANVRIKIGQADDDGTVWADEGMVNQYMGGGGGGGGGGLGGMPWQTLTGAFNVVTGLIDQDTIDNLQQDLKDQRNAADDKRKALKTYIDEKYLLSDPSLHSALSQQLDLEKVEIEAMSTQVELARMQRSNAIYRAVGGAGQVAAGYQETGGIQAYPMPGGGWGVPGPNGGLVPLLLAGAAGYGLGKSAGRDNDRR